MSKILAAGALLLVSAGSAYGATADFVFLNKLALLIALNVVLGGVLAFCAFVIASYLWDKFRESRLRPIRVSSGNRRGRVPGRHSRIGADRRKAVNE